MDPSSLIPAADPILVPWGWFKVLLILTFIGHILLMNAMLGTALIGFAGGIFSRTDRGRTLMEKDISKKLTIIIAFTINFGVAPLLFLQVLYGQFLYVSSQLIAVWWLAVVLLLIAAYYGAYYYKFEFERITQTTRTWLMGGAGILLLLVAFVFVNNMTLMLTPENWPAYFENPHGTLLNLSDPTLFPRYLHFVTASVAMGGLFIAIVWSLSPKKDHPLARQNIERGLRWFVYATLVQIVIGFWFQMSLPREIMLLFMGKSSLHTGLFMVSLILVVGTLFLGIKQRVWPTTACAVLLVALMILMRDLVRTAYLDPHFKLSQLEVLGQYSPLLAFLIALGIGLGLVGYVLWLVRTQTA